VAFSGKFRVLVSPFDETFGMPRWHAPAVYWAGG
jgi:hypothetical protein